MEELGQRMTSREFSEWMAYARLEPFGAIHEQRMIATLTALTANVNRDRKQRPKPYTEEDFMPGETAEPESAPEDLRAAERARVDAFFVGIGGKGLTVGGGGKLGA